MGRAMLGTAPHVLREQRGSTITVRETTAVFDERASTRHRHHDAGLLCRRWCAGDDGARCFVRYRFVAASDARRRDERVRWQDFLPAGRGLPVRWLLHGEVRRRGMCRVEVPDRGRMRASRMRRERMPAAAGNARIRRKAIPPRRLGWLRRRARALCRGRASICGGRARIRGARGLLARRSRAGHERW